MVSVQAAVEAACLAVQCIWCSLGVTTRDDPSSAVDIEAEHMMNGRGKRTARPNTRVTGPEWTQ